MATITLKGGIYYDTDKHAELIFGGSRYRFFGGELQKFSTYIPICEHTLTVDIGDYDPRMGHVEALQAKRAELNAQFAAAVVEIDRQINELLAIEMSPVEA